jgi:hypothetical protein
VRPTITINSFRHLWIGEMLMAGVDVLLVTRTAGTSVAMIERVYGHFRKRGSIGRGQTEVLRSKLVPFSQRPGAGSSISAQAIWRGAFVMMNAGGMIRSITTL